MKTLVALAMMTGATMWAQEKKPPEQQKKPDAAAAAKAGLEKSIAAEKPAAAEAGAPAKPNLAALPPATVVATVDGRQVTAGMLLYFLQAYPQQVQQQALSNPVDFIKNFAVAMRIAREGEQEKLDQQSPYKEQIEAARMQVLYLAEADRKNNSIQISPEDIQKLYDSSEDRYTQAKVKAIYVKFSTEPVSTADSNGNKVLTEDEAKAKIEGLLKQARGGADFGKLAKDNSDDPESAAKEGDLGAISKAAPGLPEAIKTAIFSAKAGDITEPVRQPNGFYIFRVEETGKKPLDEVREQIEAEIRNARLQAWFKSLQENLNVKMEGPFSEQPSPAQSAKPTPAK
jgi:peptidyl-prolyl cis-trans isomerase C